MSERTAELRGSACTDVFASTRLSVVLPTRNEAGNLPRLRAEMLAALAGIAHEIVVVDDSTDDVTRAALADIAAADPRWRVIARPPAEQTGLSTAVVQGIAAARGEAVCVMDADLQHPPDVIPALLAAVEEGADLAVASRHVAGGSRAGLDGSARRWVSRGATWAAQALFREARRSTDPLSGFFCCRRSAVAGIELRPVGFKIFLELLVCAPTLEVVDVPMCFRSRSAGESKASAQQGYLYVRHLMSLFLYVPGSARTLKYLLVSLSGWCVFLGLLALLVSQGDHPLPAWFAAFTVSVVGDTALHRTLTFRDLVRVGEPDGGLLHYPLAAVGGLASLVVFMALLTNAGWHTVAAAAAGQAVGSVITFALNRPRVRARVRAVLLPGAPPSDLATLGRRLDADRVWWFDLDAEQPREEAELLGRPLPWGLLRSAAEAGRPVLWVEASPRLQPRVNVERTSAILIPVQREPGAPPTVAVLSRHSAETFGVRHLEEAMAWLGGIGQRWHERVAHAAAVAEGLDSRAKHAVS